MQPLQRNLVKIEFSITMRNFEIAHDFIDHDVGRKRGYLFYMENCVTKPCSFSMIVHNEPLIKSLRKSLEV